MAGLSINYNFAKSNLASSATDVDNHVHVAAGDGAKFPATGDFLCVIWDSAYASPVSDSLREIVKVTSRTVDSLSITRAQESTAAKAWSTDDHIALVITAGKIDELEDELSYASSGSNLLQNVDFAQCDGTTGAPAGWTLVGAAATVTMANGTYGYRALTLTAGGGAPATLTQVLSSDVPKIAGSYGISAFAKVSAGGAGSISLGAVTAAVMATDYTLTQVSGTVAAWDFVITIDAGKSITVELPTVVLGKVLPYPMYGIKSAIGHQQLGAPQRGIYRGTIANGATVTINIAGLAQSGTDVLLGLTCYWHSTSTASGGVFRATQYRSSAPAFQTPVIYVEGTLSSATDIAGYVCLYNNANVLTIKNSLAGGAEIIRVVVDYIWG